MNSGMNTVSENSEPIIDLKKIYVYCRNNSTWVWENDVREFFTIDTFSAYGEVLYKFSGKCHLLPNHFTFVEFIRDEDAQKFLEATKKPDNENEEELETEEITKPTLIDKLGDDCLLEIFSYLALEKRLEMEDVCVRWRDVSKRAWYDVRELEVYSSLELIRKEEDINSEFIEKLLMRCGAYLHTLKLHYICSSEILLLIGKYCHNLTKIELKFMECLDEDFIALAKMKKLESVMFADFEREYNLSNCLQSLPKTVKSIQIGDLNPVYSNIIERITPETINNVLGEFNAINSLTIGYHKFKRYVTGAISRVGTITKLGLPFCEIRGLNLLTNLSGLEHLNLQSVYEVDNNFLAVLSTKCKKLKYLNVSYCRKLSDEGITKLRNLENLEVLLINGIKECVTDLSLGQLRGIKRLECRKCWEVSDDGIIELIANCPNLENLNVRCTCISVETLQFAMFETKYRENSVILRLTTGIPEAYQMNLDVESEDYSPFLVINDSDCEMRPLYLDSEEHYTSLGDEDFDENAFPSHSDSE